MKINPVKPVHKKYHPLICSSSIGISKKSRVKFKNCCSKCHITLCSMGGKPAADQAFEGIHVIRHGGLCHEAKKKRILWKSLFKCRRFDNMGFQENQTTIECSYHTYKTRYICMCCFRNKNLLSSCKSVTFECSGSEREKVLNSESAQSKKRSRTHSASSPTNEEQPEKRNTTGLIELGSLCPFNIASKIGMRAIYLLVKPLESEIAEVINIHDLSVSTIRDTTWSGCALLASKLNGWVLMIRPDNRSILYFNLIRRTRIDLPPLPDATERCKGTFDSIPTLFDNKTVIMANTTENGADVTKFFIHKDRSDQWAVYFIENQGRERIDGPLLYRDKLIWIRNGNSVEIINEDGQFHQFAIANLDLGPTSIFTRHGSLYIVKCMVLDEMPRIVKIVLEPNAFEVNQSEVITTIAPFDILLVPEKEASYVYNPVEEGDGNCLYFGSDFNHHLSIYKIAGGAIVERAREFICENCPCQAVFYGV